MKLVTTRNKNGDEHYYVSHSFINDKGKSTSKTVRKLGTLFALQEELGLDKAGVIAWCKEQVKLDTKKYDEENKACSITVSPTKKIDSDKTNCYSVGYLILQSIYYKLRLPNTCRRIKRNTKCEYDLNAILKDLIYARVLQPCSKLSTYKACQSFIEKPNYELHDIYRALSLLAENLYDIQSDVYKNSNFINKRNTAVLYYDCTNYYFEIEQEAGMRKYGKSKEHRPNPIVQMGLFMDYDGIPLGFDLFSGNENEQPSLKNIQTQIMKDYDINHFVVCTDAGLGSMANREFNNLNGRAFITTQSLKKLDAKSKKWLFEESIWKKLGTDEEFKIEDIQELHKLPDAVYYKEQPYKNDKITNHKLIVTYSTKYARYQKKIRDQQVNRANKIIDSGVKISKGRSNQNSPMQYISVVNCTEDGEVADQERANINNELIDEAATYDGLYGICTNLEDDVKNIIGVSERRWEIEECFRIMKTDFEARPVYLSRDDRIKAHFMTCVLALIFLRVIEKQLDYKYTAPEIIRTLRDMKVHKIEGLGYMPIFTRTKLTDDLLRIYELDLDYEVIKNKKMREIIKKSKEI